MRGQEVAIRSPRDAMAAGIVLLPEDRRPQGDLGFSVRKNITLPAMARPGRVVRCPCRTTARAGGRRS